MSCSLDKHYQKRFNWIGGTIHYEKDCLYLQNKKTALGVGICLICGGVLVAVLNSTNAMVEASGESGTSTEASSEMNNRS